MMPVKKKIGNSQGPLKVTGGKKSELKLHY